MLENPKERIGQEKTHGSGQCKGCCGKVKKKNFKVGRVEQLFWKKSFFKNPNVQSLYENN